MAEQKNPLREWRGSVTPCGAAFQLDMSQDEYLILESHPKRSHVNSSQIVNISQTTGIPLPVLVDWLTETTTKEMA